MTGATSLGRHVFLCPASTHFPSLLSAASTSASSELRSVGLAVAAALVGLSTAVSPRRGHLLQFDEILRRIGECIFCGFGNWPTRVGVSRLRALG